MNHWIRPAVAAVVMTLVLSACRFGNYADTAQPTSAPPTQTLFFTKPTAMATTVVFQDDTQRINSAAPLTSIPTNVLNTFSNPFYYYSYTDPNQSAKFVGMNLTDYMVTTVDTAGNVNDNVNTGESQFWKNPNCLSYVNRTQVGKLDRSKSGTVAFSDGSTASVAGRLSMDFALIRVIHGDCLADLQELAGCYSHGTNCDATQLNSASALFDIFIRQTGVLKIEEATQVKALVYQIHFE